MKTLPGGTHRWLVKVEKLPELNSQVAGQGGEVTRVELTGDWSRWRSYQSGHLTGGWSRWRSYQSGHLSPGEEKLADGGLAEERAEVSGTTPPRLETIQKI